MDGISPNDLRAVIRVSYLKSQKIDTRVFFRESESESDYKSLTDETLKESITNDFIYLDINIQYYGRQFSSLISGGRYDFSDNDPITGYVLRVRVTNVTLM